MYTPLMRKHKNYNEMKPNHGAFQITMTKKAQKTSASSTEGHDSRLMLTYPKPISRL